MELIGILKIAAQPYR